MPHDYEMFVSNATIKSYQPFANFSYRFPSVSPINDKIRALRNAAGMSQNEVAAALGCVPTTYIAKEDPAKFKAPYLPVAFAKRLAAIYAPRGVDPQEVMALAGVSLTELTVPEPPTVTVSLPVTLPNVDALTEMFENLLLASATATEADRARVLAEHFPTSFASVVSQNHPAKPPRSIAKRRSPSPSAART